MKHYTMTLCENPEDFNQFVKTGAHPNALRKSAGVAKEIRIVRIEANELPSWKDAEQLLEAKGY